MSTTSEENAATTGVDRVRAEIDWDRREPVSVAIQNALVEALDRPATKLDPLAEYVDPDALEDFFEHGVDPTDRRLTFEYDEHVVHVDGAGHVSVE